MFINLLVEHKYLLYSLFIAVLIFFKIFKSRLTQKFLFLLFLTLVFNYNLGFSVVLFHWVGNIFSIVLLYFVYTEFKKNGDIINKERNMILFTVAQWIFVILVGVYAVKSLSHLLLGKAFRDDKNIALISSPFKENYSPVVVDGGYGDVFNSSFDVNAKRYALFISGKKEVLDVASPCDGEIQLIYKTQQNGKNLFFIKEKEKFGNALVIKCNLFTGKIILGNFNSISVKLNQLVNKGDSLGQTGNSEFRSRSGLILSAVETNSLDPEVLFNTGEGTPLKINNTYYVKNDSIDFISSKLQ